MKHLEFCAQFVPVGGRVLDVGSGRGDLVVAMAKLGFNVSGIEINPEYVAETKAKALAAGVSVSVAVGEAEALGFAENSFDFLNCSEVTEHVVDPEKICREMYQVLKPGSRAYISFHNRFGIYDYHYHLYGINWLPRVWTEPVLQLLGKQKPDGDKGHQKLITMHYYTFGQAVKLLKKIGFAVEDIRISKIKQRFGWLAPLVLALYYVVLRPLYFNTFHLLVRKPL